MSEPQIHPPARSTWVRWQIVFILGAFTGLNHFHRVSLPTVINEVMRDYEFTETDMSWIYSAFLWGYVVFMIPGGWLADRRGAWFALAVSGGGTALLVAITGQVSPSLFGPLAFAALLVIRCLFGILTSPLFPAAGRTVGAWIPFGSRAWANGLVLGATTIGVSLAPIVFGNLSDFVGWRSACAIMGLLTVIVALVWIWYGRNTPVEHPAVSAAELALLPSSDRNKVSAIGGHDFLKMLRNPSLIFLTINYAAVGYYEYTLFYWMKYYFSNVRHFSETASRNYTALVSSAMIIAMPLGGILSDRLVRWRGYRAGRTAVPIFGMLASAVLLFVATRVNGELAAVSLFYLSHAAIGLCEAPTWVAALELGGRNCATSGAIVNTGGNLGGSLGPIVAAYVAQKYGWNAGFDIASLVCLFGVVQWFGVRLPSPTMSEPSGNGNSVTST